MPSNADIVRTACLLIEEYGEMAPMGASIRADHLSDRGDQAGHAVWMRVAQVAEDLLAEDRPPDTAVH
ncbi:MAG: hypothetical protein OXR84_00725 [Magnetovibrio sp.]|nr:hypothetical protein [Magnetovibrio sp.]